MGFFDLFKSNKEPDTVIIKTAEQKAYEEKINAQKRRCPVCGHDPNTGDILLSGFGTTDGVYNYGTCGHCNTDYKYKK